MIGGMTARRSRLLPAVAALGALLLAAACTSTVGGSAVPVQGATGTPAPPSTGPVDIGPVPAGLERFYTQRLDWGSCADLATDELTSFYESASLQCADLEVPLSYDDPAGPAISIGVLRKQATDPASRIGSVVFNPGGPGVSGMEMAGSFGALGIGAELNRSFDFVGFDPRGVANSTPAIDCQTDAERDASRAEVIRTRTQAEVDAANSESEQYAQECAQRSGPPDGIDGAAFLASVGTPNVARDLDVLRAALGDRALTYVGLSYGTSIGSWYAQLFGANVRAMILDGAVAPNADPGEELIAQAEGFQTAFDEFADWCVQQPDCVFGDDAGNAVPIYQSLVRPLLDEPLPLKDGRVISFDDANTGTRQALYAEALWKPLSAALLDLSRGSGDALMQLADYYDGRDPSGRYTNVLEAFQAISCIDGGREIDPAAADALAEKYAAAAPFSDSGDPPRAIDDPCEYWVVAPDPEQQAADYAGLPRVLVISTTQDPATPYQAGVDLADALGAALLTVDGTSHTAYLGIGNTCVDDAGTRYLITLELPEDGATCS